MNWLTDEWRQGWKWFQVQLGAVIAIAPELYNQADVLQSFLSPAAFRHIMAALGVMVIINSVRKKKS